MILLKLATRNLFRHFRRSLLVLSMMIGGFCAIVLFKGFSHYVLNILAEITINTQTGHVQVGKTKMWKRMPVDTPREYLLKDPKGLMEKIRSLPGVVYASGRTEFFALLNGGDQSVSTVAIAYDPNVETRMRENLKVIDGHNFTGTREDEVLVGSGLRDQLRLKPGQNVTLVGITYDGTMNATDLEVAGIFQSGMRSIDDISILLPLSAAQRLVDTDTFEKVVIAVDDRNHAKAIAQQIRGEVVAGDSEMEVKSWTDIAQLYNQVESFWRVQNGLVGAILFTIVFLGILNTVGMAVMERTGEIGTVRALGDRASDVLKQFLLEGLVLGAIACALAIPISIAAGLLINSANIPLDLPGSSTQVSLTVDFIPSAFVLAAAVTIFTTLVATFFPALRATRLAVVDALRRNV